MALVRIARIADLTEARVIEAALTAHDIPVAVPEAQFGQTDFLMQTALGGFQILVPEEHAAEAAAYIREHRAGGLALQPDPAEVLDEDDDDGAWEEGRRKRRNMAVRWLVVIGFFGPVVLAVLFLVIGRIAAVFV